MPGDLRDFAKLAILWGIQRVCKGLYRLCEELTPTSENITPYTAIETFESKDSVAFTLIGLIQDKVCRNLKESSKVQTSLPSSI
jgi:hypothetical protein